MKILGICNASDSGATLFVDNDVIVHNSDFSIYTDAISGFRVIPQIDSYPSQSVMDNMLSTIMQTGRLPDGNYSFRVDLYTETEPTNKMDSTTPPYNKERYEEITAEVIDPRGHPNNPMTDAEVEQKFRTMTSGLLPGNRCDEALARLWKLEEMADASDVVKLFGDL